MLEEGLEPSRALSPLASEASASTILFPPFEHILCGRRDSNPHALASASTSSWCVYQLRHDRVCVAYGI